MPEYNVALLDAFHGRVRLSHVHGAANANEAAVALAESQTPEEQYAGGSTIASDVVNSVSGTTPSGATFPPQRIPALPTTVHQP